MNYKKVIIRIVTGILVIFASYFVLHIYANNKVINSYAAGFEKNPLGDYCKNTSDMVLCVYEAPLFQSKTNLSISSSMDKIDMIIWVPIYGGDLKSGLVITDDNAERTYHIELDENFETDIKEYNEILVENQEAIDALKLVIHKEWNIDL